MRVHCRRQSCLTEVAKVFSDCFTLLFIWHTVSTEFIQKVHPMSVERHSWASSGRLTKESVENLPCVSSARRRCPTATACCSRESYSCSIFSWYNQDSLWKTTPSFISKSMLFILYIKKEMQGSGGVHAGSIGGAPVIRLGAGCGAEARLCAPRKPRRSVSRGAQPALRTFNCVHRKAAWDALVIVAQTEAR